MIFRRGARVVRRITAIMIFFALLIGLYGCETMEGAGRDIQKAGSTIERAAK